MPRRAKTTATPRPQPPMPITVAEDAYHRPLFTTFEEQERTPQAPVNQEVISRPDENDAKSNVLVRDVIGSKRSQRGSGRRM